MTCLARLIGRFTGTPGWMHNCIHQDHAGTIQQLTGLVADLGAQLADTTAERDYWRAHAEGDCSCQI